MAPPGRSERVVYEERHWCLAWMLAAADRAPRDAGRIVGALNRPG